MTMLALWFDSWTTTDWTPAPAPAPTVAPTGSSFFLPGQTTGGGGHGPDEVHIPPDFWDVRERYLQSLFPEAPQPDIAVDNSALLAEWEERHAQIESLTAERSEAIIELRRAADLDQMRSQGAKIAELTSKIATLNNKLILSRFMKH
jgi:hypothetical protein